MTDIDEPQVVVRFTNGSEEFFDLSEFKEIQIPLNHGQHLLVEAPRPLWYWGQELVAKILVMGGSRGLGVFKPNLGNGMEVASIPVDTTKEKSHG